MNQKNQKNKKIKNKIFAVIIVIIVLLVSNLFTNCAKNELKLLNLSDSDSDSEVPEGYICLSVYGKDGEPIIVQTCANSDYKKNITVADLSKDVCRELKIPFVFSGMGTMTYVQGIDGLFEYDYGAESGWLYSVNGEFQGVGCDSYILQDRDYVEWRYTLDLGRDLGLDFDY